LSIAASYAQAKMVRNVNGVLKFNVELPKSQMMQIFVKFAWRAMATSCPIVSKPYHDQYCHTGISMAET